MASVSRDANGLTQIQFTDGGGVRRTIRLGKVAKSAAAGFKLRIEALLQDKELCRSHDAELCEWLREMPNRMYDRLVRVELVEPRTKAATVTLGRLLTDYFAALDVKPSTRTRMEQARAGLLAHFGEGQNVATISLADADAWRAKLKADGYAPATISRTVIYARSVFKWAMRRSLAARNVFAELKAGAQTNQTRQVLVSRETIAKVMDAAPDAEWRLLIVLSRFGGLRVPSEALALTWQDVDWEHNRLSVRSRKTEHHEGGGSRFVPIFPEMREHLQTVFDAAPEGSTFVVTRYRRGSNLNPQLHRIVKRAGLEAWPRLWHNLRATRQTELAAKFPLATVCAWIGNAKAVAAGHYLQVTDADWARATAPEQSDAKSDATVTPKATQHPSASNRPDSAERPETPRFAGGKRDQASEREIPQELSMVATGLEPVTPVV